jgi:Ca-activated chloride channel family protein
VTFAAPAFLAGLVLVPLALAAMVAARKRAKRYAVRFTAVPALKLAGGATPAWRRNVPLALVLAALAVLVLALAKPQKTVAVPQERASIMLVTDHSRSMLAEDVAPNRLAAAQSAARSFLAALPARVRVGAVAFSDRPDSVSAPSQDHTSARVVIDNQIADGATATGEALQAALDTLASERVRGKRAPGAIVLLSDGKTTVGRDPVDVAAEARRLRVPIYTVSLGTTAATVPSPGPGPPLAAAPDPETLERIAETAGGRAFAAEDADELSDIYKGLGSSIATKRERREITVAFAIGGSLLLLGAAVTSVRWTGRLP